MKTKIILIFLLFFTTTHLKAQTYEYVNQDDPMVLAQVIAPIGDGTTLVGTSSGVTDSFQAKLIKIDSLGNHLWTFSEFPEYYGGFERIQDIKVIDTETIYVLTSYSGCDYGGTSSLHKMNADGELMWSTPEYYIYGTNLPSIDIMEETNNILIASDNEYYIISPGGEWVQQGDLEMNARDILPLSISRFIIAGTQGFQYIDLSALQNTVVYEAEKSFKKIVSSNLNDIYLLHDEGILRIDENFQTVDSTNFEIDESYDGMDIINDTLFLFGRKDSNALIKVLDSDLNLLTEHIITGDLLYPKDLKIKDNHLFMTAYQVDGLYQNYYFSYSSIPIGSCSLWTKATPINDIINLNRPDIGVSGIVTDFIVFDSTACFQNTPSLSNCSFQNTQIKIKNYGTTPIENLNINSRFGYCAYICTIYSSYFNAYDSINLAPNEELIIDIDDLDFSGLILKSDSSYNFCFWTSMPNNKMDNDLSNNQFCLTVENITILVGIDDLPSEKNIMLYPNPTKNTLYLETDIQKGQLQVFDISGKLLLEKEVNNEKQAIDISALLTGIYIVKVIGQERQYVAKVLKE